MADIVALLFVRSNIVRLDGENAIQLYLQRTEDQPIACTLHLSTSASRAIPAQTDVMHQQPTFAGAIVLCLRNNVLQHVKYFVVFYRVTKARTLL